MSAPPSCSSASLAAGEPLIGSAPHAVAWVALEQNGPWGARAFTQSHLDPVLGAEIERRAAAAGVRPALVRRPGRHADDHTGRHPTVLVAHTGPEDPWLLTGRLTGPERLLDLDWEAVAAGERPDWAELAPSPLEHLLVCTNGTRDACCAVLGRPVVEAAARHRPDRVWEVTHTSGHRFAATTVLLPSGHLHGRVLDPAVLLDDADAGRLTLTGWRGRSTWPAAGQVAEDVVRRAEQLGGAHDLLVEPSGADGVWTVRHRDGRQWRVQVTTEAPRGERPESCGKPAKPVARTVGVLLGP
ncbi:MAG: sucrase ferredoxin [Marmoricola sp.]